MVENWDGPPTGYDWKQFLASVRLVRLTKLDSRPWSSTATDTTEPYEKDRTLSLQAVIFTPGARVDLSYTQEFKMISSMQKNSYYRLLGLQHECVVCQFVFAFTRALQETVDVSVIQIKTASDEYYYFLLLCSNDI